MLHLVVQEVLAHTSLDKIDVHSSLRKNYTKGKKPIRLLTPQHILNRLLVTGPLAHNFYKMLDKVVPPYAWAAAWKRLLIDRLGFAPLLLLLSFYILSRMEVGRGVGSVDDSYYKDDNMNNDTAL